MTETLSRAMPPEIDAAVRRILQEACDRELKLVTAESCTGGLLASLFTDVEGCSHAFERGFVVYTEDAKHELLGVSRDLLDNPGPVSEAVARAMAEGGLANSSGDLCAAVTGFAGAAGSHGEPGLVHLAIAVRDGPILHREEHFGDIGRGGVRLGCVDVALQMLRQAMDIKS